MLQGDLTGLSVGFKDLRREVTGHQARLFGAKSSKVSCFLKNTYRVWVLEITITKVNISTIFHETS